MATTQGTYNLHLPTDTDLADVPGDFMKLDTTITTALDKKLDKDTNVPGDNPYNYQKKILVTTTVPTSGAGYKEGDIIFVVST
jgi:hypothetical protein